MKTHKTILTTNKEEFDKEIEKYLQEKYEMSRLKLLQNKETNIITYFAYMEKEVKTNQIGYN